MDLPRQVTLVEVGARDGLQNEKVVLGTDEKVDLIRRCRAAGLRRIEVASFVHPRRVPQMADAEAVLAALGPSGSGVSYIGLVLNRRGLERALETEVDEVNFVVGATERFNRANAGASPHETMGEIETMVAEAKAAELGTSVTVSVAFGCPYEGEVREAAVKELVTRAVASGIDEIALGDTIGVAVPQDVTRLLTAIAPNAGGVPVRCHFHDTRNTAVANVAAALRAGVATIDSSVGGAGGCPFAPNATGNVATEDVLYLLARSGISTGVDPEAVIETGRWLGAKIGRDLPGSLGRAGWFPAVPSDRFAR